MLIFTKQNVVGTVNFNILGFGNIFLREPISPLLLEEGASPPPRHPKVGPSGKRRRGTIERRQAAAAREEEEDAGEESGQGTRAGAVSPGEKLEEEEERENLFQDETSSR